jgi:hypothetical protein
MDEDENQLQNLNSGQGESVGCGTSSPRNLLQCKDRVSFGTDMSMDSEPSEGDSIVKTKLELATAVQRFHARKFGSKGEHKTEKKACVEGKLLG